MQGFARRRSDCDVNLRFWAGLSIFLLSPYSVMLLRCLSFYLNCLDPLGGCRGYKRSDMQEARFGRFGAGEGRGGSRRANGGINRGFFAFCARMWSGLLLVCGAYMRVGTKESIPMSFCRCLMGVYAR